MIINFNLIPETVTTALHGGDGEITAKMYADEKRKVIPCRIHPGGSIGPHRHETSEEVCYVLYGTGVARCDGNEEPLAIDVCHICPKGSEHSIVNTGLSDLVMLTVITEEKE